MATTTDKRARRLHPRRGCSRRTSSRQDEPERRLDAGACPSYLDPASIIQTDIIRSRRNRNDSIARSAFDP